MFPAGDLIAFVLTVWASFLISRFVRFLLEEDVYPRVHLKRGLPYAISNTVHYLIVFIGFLVAVAALGFDMTKVTILVGAFSVGVGFGLQNIFNNFISGLILLFERPISIGDIIQIGDASGVVERIGIRASIIRKTNGSEVIVPNGQLISDRLTNWTLSNRQHGVELPVAVAQGNDPNRVREILEGRRRRIRWSPRTRRRRPWSPISVPTLSPSSSAHGRIGAISGCKFAASSQSP